MKNHIYTIILFVLFLVGCDSKTLKMESHSMEPTIMKGDKVTVDFSAYSNQKPNRWDVVAYDGPNGHIWIHRVVGLPGEKVYLEEGRIFINDGQLEIPESLQNIKIIPDEMMFNRTPKGPFKTYSTPMGSYFVLGDNGGRSADSRVNGPVALEKIKGKATF